VWKHARVSGWRRWRAAAVLIVAATLLQLVAATFFASTFEQFEGKAFGARLVAYPVMMLLVPAVWAYVRRRRRGPEPLPWLGFTLIMLPFLIDVTGNTLDL
jgi:peptidoglycan/LPS O-acetylase OafA/YrhL